MQRRQWLRRLAGWVAAGCSGSLFAQPGSDDEEVSPQRRLRFPRDHGAHLGTRIEWWYATGWLGTPEAPSHGFQLTFFRSGTGLGQQQSGRFVPRHLLFAHAAVTSLVERRHQHAQRLTRWNGQADAGAGVASVQDAALRLGHAADRAWTLTRQATHWQARLPTSDFALDLKLQRTQPLLLQGDQGYSRKGPDAGQASHYYSEPQLAVSGSLREQTSGPLLPVQGVAWLDHEWSQQILHPQAVGWDWVGMNLFDGGALTAFVLRRQDGSVLWGGGSFRAAGDKERSFTPDALRMRPGRRWMSPATGARYPMEWQLECPAGRFSVRSLLDAQELDSRQSIGTAYWEGLSELLDSSGKRVGLGYLEMTGYSGRLQMG